MDSSRAMSSTLRLHIYYLRPERRQRPNSFTKSRWLYLTGSGTELLTVCNHNLAGDEGITQLQAD